MFENIQAYAGNVIGESTAEEAGTMADMVSAEPQTAEEIIDYAKQEAEDILQAARNEASSERSAILENAIEQSERQISENVMSAVAGLRIDLWSARAAMGDVLINAMNGIVGRIGHDKMMLDAIDKAIEEYGTQQTLTVYGNTKTLERLRLVAIGSKRNLKDFGILFKLDAGLADGRCVLSNGEARVDVGLDGQIDALKKVFHADAVRGQKIAQTQVSTFGKLM